MIIELKHNAPGADVRWLEHQLSTENTPVRVVRNPSAVLVVGPGSPSPDMLHRIERLPSVLRVTSTSVPFPLVSRDYQRADSVVHAAGVDVGGPAFTLIAGPCSVESADQLDVIADAVARAGAVLLRGGAVKPRSSPYSFQGLGERGMRLLREQRHRSGLGVVTEIMDHTRIDEAAASADVLQVGARSMQNFPLLRALGRCGKPVLLKRGLANTIDEWLLAAEYLVSEGNPDVILCERGIRGFEPATRFTLDISAIPVVKQRSHLPVIVDPSHASGHAFLVAPLSLAAAAVGADGLIVDVHNEPAKALCDATQALTPAEFGDLVDRLRPVLAAVGRPLATLDTTSRPAATAS